MESYQEFDSKDAPLPKQIKDNKSADAAESKSNISIAPRPDLKNVLKAFYISEKNAKLPKLIDTEELPDQNLADYYVKLKMLLKAETDASSNRQGGYDKIAGEKIDIETQQLFQDMGEKHQASNKILIIGGAGVGKTTLLQYMAYKWGSRDLWQDKFDYVFRIKLKKLLTSWQGDYNKQDLESNPLAHFIHASFEDEDIMSQVRVGEIASVISSDKALFLLDGYDEVAHLRKRDDISGKILNAAMKGTANTVMTSRPNALYGNRGVIEIFGRQVENTGLDNEGVVKYLDNLFKNEVKADIEESKIESISQSELNSEELKKGLLDFLSKNISVRQICNVPINVAMLSLIWQDDEMRSGFEDTIDEIPLSSLYENMILWVGKRYLKKFKNENVDNIDSGKIFEQDMTKFLCKVAYDAFTDRLGKLAVDGKLMKKAINSYDSLYPKDVHNHNLLRPEGSIAKEHNIRLVDEGKIQEMVNDAGSIDDIWKLGDNRPVIVIGERKSGRKVPRKLLIKGAGDETLDFAIKTFPGFLRQSVKEMIDGEGSVRVKLSNDSSLQEKKFYDWFGNQLKASKIHYFAHLTFQEFLTAYQFKQELMGDKGSDGEIEAARFIAQNRNNPRYLMSLKFLSGLISTDDREGEDGAESKADLACKRFWEAAVCNVDGMIEIGTDRKVALLMHLLGEAKVDGEIDSRIPNLKAIEDFIDVVVLEDIARWSEQIKESGYISSRVARSLERILFDEDYGWAAFEREKILKESATGRRLSAELKAGDVAAGADDEKKKEEAPDLASRDKLQAVVIDLVGRMRGKVLAGSDRGDAELFAKLTGIITSSGDGESGWRVKLAAIEYMREFIAAGGRDLLEKEKEALDSLLSSLKGLLQGINLQSAGADLMVDLVDTGVIGSGFIREQRLLHDLLVMLKGKDEFLQRRATKILGKISSLLDGEIKAKLVERLIEMLRCEDWYAVNYIVAAKALGKVASSLDAEAKAKLVESLSEMLNKNKYEGYCAVKALCKVVPSLDTVSKTKLVERLTEMLKSENLRIREDMAEVWGKLASSLNAGDRTTLIEQLTEILGSDNKCAREVVPRALGKMAPSLDATTQNKLVESLIEILKSESWQTRKAAVEALRNVASSLDAIDTGIQTQLVENLTEVLGSENEDAKKAAVEALRNVASSLDAIDTGIQTQLVENLIEILRSKDWNGPQSAGQIAVKALRKVIKLLDGIDATTQNKLVESLSEVLKHQSEGTRKDAARTLVKMASSLDTVSKTKLVKRLSEMLGSGNKDAVYGATHALDKVAPSLDTVSKTKLVERLSEMLRSEDESAMKGAAYALGDVASSLDNIDASTQAKLVEALSKMLGSEDYHARQFAAEALGKVASSLDTVSKTKLVESLSEMLGSENYYAREGTAYALGYVAPSLNGIDASIQIKLVESLSEMLGSDSESAILGAAEALGDVASSLDNIDASTQAKLVEALSKILKNKSFYSMKDAACALSNVAPLLGGIDAAIQTKFIESFIEMLGSKQHKYAIHALANAAPVLEATIQTKLVESLNEMLGSEDWQIRGYADKVWGKMASSLDTVSKTKLVESFIEMLGSENNYASSGAANVLSKLFASLDNIDTDKKTALVDFIVENGEVRGLKAMMESKKLQYTKILLDHDNKQVRDNAAKRLKRQFRKQEFEQEVTSSYKSALGLLGIVRDNKLEQMLDGDEKELVKLALKALKKVQEQFGSKESMIWLNEHFDEMLSYSREPAKDLFKAIYGKALADGQIDEIEKEFIIKCITKAGITSSITADGEVLFEGNYFKLEGKTNIEYLDEIARAVFNQGKDPMSSQYINHKPMFKSDGSALHVASSDKEATYSIVRGEVDIDVENWYASLIYSAGISGGNIESVKEVFILLEGRDVFGRYIAKKIKASGTESEIYTHNPNVDNDEIAGKIFGSNEYDLREKLKPRYFAKSTKVEYDQTVKLEGSIAFDENLAAKEDIMKESNILVSGLNIISSDYTEIKSYSDLRDGQYQEYKLSDLFTNDRERVKMHRTHSLIIDNHKGVKDAKEQINKINKKIEKVDFEYLQNQIELEQKDAQELKTINDSPKLKGFYDALRWQLNSLYLASASISTGMLENQKTGVTGKLGDLIGGVSGHIPFIGIGVALIGDVLKEIDANSWDGKIERYTELAVDSKDMAELAERLARKLVLSLDLDLIEEDVVAVGSGLIESAYDIFETASAEISVSGGIASGLQYMKDIYDTALESSDVRDFADRIFRPDDAADPSDQEKASGQEKAEIIAKFLIRKIYAGEVDISGSAEDIIDNLINILPKEFSKAYESDSKIQDENKSADIVDDASVVKAKLVKKVNLSKIQDMEKLMSKWKTGKYPNKKSIFNQIKYKASKDKWHEESSYRDSDTWGREVEEFLAKDYLERKFKDDINMRRFPSKDDYEHARIVIFKYICEGVKSSINARLCIKKYIDEYRDLAELIAENNELASYCNMNNSLYRIMLDRINTGKGVLQIDIADEIFGYDNSLHEYQMDGVDAILKLRADNLPGSNDELMILPSERDAKDLETALSNLLSEDQPAKTILLPYLEKGHWVGLVVSPDKDNLQDSLQIDYLDSENRPASCQLVSVLENVANAAGLSLSLSQPELAPQRAGNCGAEVIENFMLYVSGSRLPQEKAVQFHSLLLEQDLMQGYAHDKSVSTLGVTDMGELE